MEQTERGRKAAEVELMEVGERANMLHTQNTALINHKRKLEGEVQNLQGEIEDQYRKSSSIRHQMGLLYEEYAAQKRGWEETRDELKTQLRLRHHYV